MDFTADWTSQHYSNWAKLLKGLKNKPNLNFLEIGCFEGRATLWFLENILTDKSSKIIVIDTFNGNIDLNVGTKVDMRPVYDRFMTNTEPYKDQIEVWRGSSQDLLPKADRNQFDFVYVDGEHTSEACLKDMMNSWDLLNNGGIMVVDDVEWYSYLDPIKNPFLGVDAFLSVYRGRYQLLHKAYQLFIKKL